ncbi:MAG TPA: rRNA maturation RNase YbeY [Candidatus Paceibacterota bacterium]|nr:rRNA maturation RNase YbeY [Candidatus Paceibacterota bacterium]
MAERSIPAESRRFFEAAAALILKRLRPSRRPRPTVDVRFLPNADLRRLKKHYLKKDAAFVNVLSFPEPARFPHPDRPGHLGEICLNRAYVRPSRRAEGLQMLVHGVLHLLGYRHDRKRDTIRMERLEERLLKEWQKTVRPVRRR